MINDKYHYNVVVMLWTHFLFVNNLFYRHGLYKVMYSWVIIVCHVHNHAEMLQTREIT